VNVYAAGKFERAEEVRVLQQMLREAGHTITADWTRHSAAGKGGLALQNYLQGAAEFDLRGVEDSECVMLIHDDNCRAGFGELTAGLVLGKLPIVIGGLPARQWPIFYFDPRVKHFETNAGAVRYVTWLDNAFAVKKYVPEVS
jgi:hypothetical protein